MPHAVADMSIVKHAVALSGLNAGLRQLINDIMNDSNDAKFFFNHGYDKDPATNGGKLSLNV